ncbi:MAG TPA: substrate-binding domain-containing protein [Streptosporangiaceae bacterium]|nr:substrate-binding domain-containing protein [Streptosporangiaceae bacterium]
MSRGRKALMLIGAVGLPGLLLVMAASGPTASAAQQSGSGASSKVSYAAINGAGSTWAQIAVDEWIANISNFQVNFSGDGSAAGRTAFAEKTIDFAVSDIGYQGVDPITHQTDASPNRPYAYLPVTGGGTSFPYNLTVNGHQVTNLRLSGKTLAEIFTQHITNWDSPQIQQDNNLAHPFPNMPITTVVEDEGSGTSYQFSRYLNDLYGQYWKPFDNGFAGATEYWPTSKGNSQVAESSSAQVMNYITSAPGSIGYDEYAYPLQAGFPVVALENAAHYFVYPSEYNDAVALTTAVINYQPKSPDYLLENLNNVYTNPDRRAYPLSSYSYTIIPTSSSDELMNKSGGFPAKAESLATFLKYSICNGQDYIGRLGYSALPINLVQAGFKQILKIKAAAPEVSLAALNIRQCNNPTFDSKNLKLNLLAQEAPFPRTCAEAGHGPCPGILNANANGGKGSGKKGTGNGASPSASPSSGARGSGGTGKSGSSKSGSGNSGTGSSATGTSGTGGSSGNGTTGNATDVASNLPATQSGLNNWALGVLVVLLLLAIVIIPPIVSRGISGRGRQW